MSRLFYAAAAALLGGSLVAAQQLAGQIPARANPGNASAAAPLATSECGTITGLTETRNPPREREPGQWHFFRTSGVSLTPCAAGNLAFTVVSEADFNGSEPHFEVWQAGELLLAGDAPAQPKQFSVPVAAGPVELLLTNGSAAGVTSARQMVVTEVQIP